MDTMRTRKRQDMRERLCGVLHKGNGRAGHAFNFLLVIFILLSAAIVPLSFFPTFGPYIAVVHGLEAVIVTVFTIEYLLRIYSAPSRARYIFSFFGMVDLLSIIPFYAGIFGMEWIRVLRLLRLLKLAEIEAAAQHDEGDILRRGVGLVEGEQVEHIITKSPVVLFLGVIPPLIAMTVGIGLFLLTQGHLVGIVLMTCLLLFALIFLWKAWLDFSYDVIYVTNLRLIFQNQHLLGRSINQVQYSAITNVKPFYPGSLSYILRYGTLVIDTAADAPGQISLDMVRRHEQAAHIIMRKCFATPFSGAPGARQAAPSDPPAAHP
jgi:hypothetical protein